MKLQPAYKPLFRLVLKIFEGKKALHGSSVRNVFPLDQVVFVGQISRGIRDAKPRASYMAEYLKNVPEY